MAKDISTPSDMAAITTPDGSDVAVDVPLKHWPLQDIATPWATDWWTSTWVSGVPQEALGWHLAQGWQVETVVMDNTTQPPTPYYTMTKNVFNHLRVLQDMLNSYTVAYNDARWANTGRYADVIDNWTALISSTENYHDDQVEDTNAHNTDFLNNLDTYMGEVDAEIDSNLSDVSTQTTLLLDDLGATEVARINEQFAASLAEQLENLMDRGMYTSSVAADITARNVRDRDEQLQKLYDSLAREKADNQHKIAEHRHRGITEKMGEFQVQLETQRTVHADNMKQMSYFLQERNQLMVGLYGFVERREDIGPSVDDLTKIAVGLGDSGAGWVSP